MTPFVYSVEAAFLSVLIIFLFTAFMGVVIFTMSIVYKLKLYLLIAELFVTLTSIILFSLFSGVAPYRYRGGEIEDLSTVCFMPLWGVSLLCSGLFAISALLLVYVIEKRLSSITPMAVKEAASALPNGLCFYDETGRVLLLNERIDQECHDLMNVPLNDGIAFWNNLKNNETALKGNHNSGNSFIIEERDGRIICYTRFVHQFGKKRVFELIGVDITDQYKLKLELEEKNENLRKLGLRLRKYGETVSEVTREKEVLAAKVKVHAKLGSLILQTKKSLLSPNDFNRELLASNWMDIINLAFTSEEPKDPWLEAEETASNVGVVLVYNGPRPPKGTIAEKIFAQAIFEGAINLARHSNGDKLFVDFKQDEKKNCLILTDNGSNANIALKEGGGLSSLRSLVENSGGEMVTNSQPRFTIRITLPRGN